MRVRVKVCGITRTCDIDAAVDAGVDAVGFVVATDRRSARNLTPQRASELMDVVCPFVSRVMVCTPNSLSQVSELLDVLSPDIVQVHSSLSEEEVYRLSSHAPVVKAVAVEARPFREVLAEAMQYSRVCDCILLDTAAGSGRVHDWGMSARIKEELDVPVVLAGGLTPHNVAEAARLVRPFGVDVSTGVEASEGIKDARLMEQLISEVRSVE